MEFEALCGGTSETSRSFGYQQTFFWRVTLTIPVTAWNMTTSATLGSGQLQHRRLFLLAIHLRVLIECLLLLSQRLNRSRHTLQNLIITSLATREKHKTKKHLYATVWPLTISYLCEQVFIQHVNYADMSLVFDFQPMGR